MLTWEHVATARLQGSVQTVSTSKTQQKAQMPRRWPQAVVAQVRGDAALLRSRVVQLRGAAGGARFDAALAAVTAEEAAAFGDVPAAVQVWAPNCEAPSFMGPDLVPAGMR